MPTQKFETLVLDRNVPLESLPIDEQAYRLDEMLQGMEAGQEAELVGLHGRYREYLENPDVTVQGFVKATKQLDKHTTGILKAGRDDVRALVEKRADVYTAIIRENPAAAGLLRDVLGKSELYGADSTEVARLLQRASPRLQDAVHAVLDEYRYTKARERAYLYGPDSQETVSIVSNVTPTARAAVNTALDGMRYEKTFEKGHIYGPDSREAAGNMRGMSGGLRAVTESVLDVSRMKKAHEKASIYGADSAEAQQFVHTASSRRAKEFIAARVKGEPDHTSAPSRREARAQSSSFDTGDTHAYVPASSLAHEIRRGRRRPLTRFAAAAGLALAATIGVTQSGVLDHAPKVTTASKPNPGDAPERGVTSPEAKLAAEPKIPSSESGICLSPAAADLLKTDCYLLPRVYEGTKIDKLIDDLDPETPDSQLLGSFVDGVKDFDLLSKDYQAALEAGLSDPYVAAIQKKIPLYIHQVASSSDENAKYIPPDKAVSFYFSGDHKQPDSEVLFPTWGSIRDTLVHEDTHAVYDMLVDKSVTDKQVDADLERMDSLCRDMVRPWVDSFYTHNQGRVKAWLNDVTSVVDTFRVDGLMSKADANVYHAAIRKTRFQYMTKERFVRTSMTQASGCDVFNPTSVLYFNMSKELDLYEYIPDHNEDHYYKVLEKYESLNSTFIRDLLKQSSSMREGGLLKGIDPKNAGHPFDTTEQLASMVTSIHLNPEGYVKAVLALPEAQRKNRIQFTTLTYKVLVREFPELAQDTNLSEVVAALKRAA